VYTGPQDRVQCVFCEGALRNWQAGDVPADEHARHFPTCPLVVSSQPEPQPPPIPPRPLSAPSDFPENAERFTLPPVPMPPVPGQCAVQCLDLYLILNFILLFDFDLEVC
jgi:hypothetical protein